MARTAPIRVSLPRPNSSSGEALSAQAVRGMQQILQNMEIFTRHLEKEILPEAMEEALQPTLDLSNYYAPISSGDMRNSSYIVAGTFGGRTVAEIGYNKNGEAPYTIFVHEMPQFSHAPPTQYKFLQRAMDEDQGAIIGRLFRSIKNGAGL